MSSSDGGATIPVNHPRPPQFPEDFVEEILTWLPVKSITRFQCLSRRFLSLTTHPKFVETHHRRSALRSPSTLLLLPNRLPSAAPAATLFDLQSQSTTVQDLVHLHVSNFTSQDHSVRVLGSRGGLVLIELSLNRYVNNKPLYVLWNPATRQFRTDLRDKLDSFAPSRFDTSCGLAYDKLVFLNHITHDVGTGTRQVRIHPVVLSLKHNSWREVEYGSKNPAPPPPPFWVCATNHGTHVKGGLYFDVLGQFHVPQESNNFVLRFDTATEGFSKVWLPDSCSGRGKRHWMDEFRDKLALFVWWVDVFLEGQERQLTELKFWLLENDGPDQQEEVAEGCWMKVYSIEIGPMARIGRPRFLAAGNTERMIFRILIEAIVRREDGGFKFGGGSISMDDPVVEEMITLIASSSSGPICKYVESLVSVHGGCIQGEPNN